MAILVSGGAGYIGSHTCIELLNAGYDVVVADNYYNASPVVLDRVKQITGKDFRFYQADMTKHEDVEKIFAECPDITAVIQFAAYKAVGESVSKPIEYYYNNLNCTLVILDVMRKHNCHNFVFSSSATVYGDPASVPITEDFPVGATTNPYGTTKAMTERILTDVCKADPTLNVALLRYFNPIGAHKSGLIGEDPNGIPNNLMPYIAKVAVGKLEKVHVFGNDYPTPDGTGVRDYIHVVDLARGHVCAIKKLETNCGLFICNLDTGFYQTTMAGGGFDHCYILDRPRGASQSLCAWASSDKTGISMKMYTTQPGIQLYTGNFLQDCPSPGKGGVPLEKYGGFALETQHFPCSPSHPEFPTTVLRAGKVFRANTTLRFFTGRQCGRL